MKPPLWLGVHESAHAISKFVLDELLPFPGPSLHFVNVRKEGNRLGASDNQRRQLMLDERKDVPFERQFHAVRNAEFDVIETLAGPVAEARQRGRWLGYYWLEEIVLKEVLTVDLAAGNDDHHIARRSLDWLAPADPVEALRDLYRQTVVLVEAEFPGIVAMARLLCEKCELDGLDFEAAWRDCRQSEAQR